MRKYAILTEEKLPWKWHHCRALSVCNDQYTEKLKVSPICEKYKCTNEFQLFW